MKRPGDLNVKCTLLLMLDHQVTNALGPCLGSQGFIWGTGGQVPMVNPSYACPIVLLFTRTPPNFLLSILSLPSTNWTPDWRDCWECTHRRGLPSCRPYGFTSNTTSCRTGTSASTSTATVTSARLVDAIPTHRSCAALEPHSASSGPHSSVTLDTFLPCPQRHLWYSPQIFSCGRLRFSEIPMKLAGLLQHPDPIVINHVIR